METDFPADELRPLEEFMERMDRGIYECLGLFEDGVLRAYGYFVKDEKTQTVLLDFLAVCPQYRGGGYGSSFMDAAGTYYASYRGILIECESEQTSADEAELSVRTRRIAFYEKNGCCRTRTRARLFGVEFDILYLPLQDGAVSEVAEQMNHMYVLMFGAENSRTTYKVWNRTSRMKQVWSWDSERIPMCQKPRLKARPSLLAALGFENTETLPRVISLVGAGGKTTTMFQLADELAERGLRVLVTTSTHIVKPHEGQAAEISHVRELQDITWNEAILTAGTPVPCRREEGAAADNAPGAVKLAQPEGLDDPKELERLLKLADVVLIEADGSGKKPVKVPREGEPVLIPQTGLVIACAGLSAVGKTFEEACFRFAEQGQWLRRKSADVIEAEDMALILMDERGSRKNLNGRYYRIVLNQADGMMQRQEAQQLIQMLPVTMQKDCVVTWYEKSW